MPRLNKSIVKEYIVLCEGRDAEEFLITYLESKAPSKDARFRNDIQVLDFGGNEELKNFLGNLKNMEGFNNVKSIAIIRDAEANYRGACESIENVLTHNNMNVPDKEGIWVNDERLRIGYLLFPFNEQNGTLEDVCLKILSEKDNKNILQMIDSFLLSLKNVCRRKYVRMHKIRLHTYLSTSDKYVGSKLGEAAHMGAFDWDCDALEPLKQFLIEGFM